MGVGGPLHKRILDHYEDLPRGERRLADLILKNGATLRNEAATDLARDAGVSKATAARFFKRLGYISFKAAQQEVRAQAEKPPEAHGGGLPGFGVGGVSISAHLDNEVQNLIRTVEQQRSDEIATAIKLLLNGDKLWVVGFGDNYPLVHFARAQLIKVRPDIRIIPLSGFSVPEEFASISSSDVMLACGVGRRTRAFRNITSSAKRAGARVILLTDAASANDAASVDVVLRCRSIGVAMFDSMTAAVSLLTYLCASLAARIGDSAIERMRLIENIHADWGDVIAGDL
ncbi:MAG: MurR/RpiR family transcriptional regulator [Kiloniellaceae bacterium]